MNGMKMQTTAERMALIRQAHEKFAKKIKVQAKFEREERVQKVHELDKKFERDERLWNDSSQYAKQYYGETFRETTRFDNDWG
jgi:hypothetical protein